jgi:HK97 family phage prohead protease
LVSVFDNVDLVGDRVVKGAFSKSLQRWRRSGDPIPVILNHDWGNLDAHIGAADANDVYETDEGLRVSGTIDLDDPFASKVYRLLKQRRIKEFSFAYDVKRERRAKEGVNELLELDIIEIGPTLNGVNGHAAPGD